MHLILVYFEKCNRFVISVVITYLEYVCFLALHQQCVWYSTLLPDLWPLCLTPVITHAVQERAQSGSPWKCRVHRAFIFLVSRIIFKRFPLRHHRWYGTPEMENLELRYPSKLNIWLFMSHIAKDRFLLWQRNPTWRFMYNILFLVISR